VLVLVGLIILVSRTMAYTTKNCLSTFCLEVAEIFLIKTIVWLSTAFAKRCEARQCIRAVSMQFVASKIQVHR
jgi:hypothetical protein